MIMSERMALENIVVLDLTRVLAGPYCGSILADFGATVIKIEQPGVGDDSRHYGPHINGESLYYGNLNRNKFGITLNLKSEEGKKIFRKMVEEADVVIENYRYGVMDRLGLGYEQLKEINPRLIYGAITGFGANGPYRDRPGYDIISQAMGGLMSVTGQEGNPPTRCGSAMGDILGGLNMAIGVLVAINARHITGKGQYVDVSIADSVVMSLEQAWQRYFVTGNVPVPHGNSYDAIAPYDSYQAKDGWMVIGCGNQRLFELLCEKILEQPELVVDERFTTVPLRVKNNKDFKIIMEKWLVDYTVNEAVEKILSAGIPAAPILNIEQIANDEHFTKARELFVPMNHPVCGEVLINGTAVKMSETKAKIRMPSPTLGQHNELILQKYGYSQDEVEKLAAEGVL